MGNVTLKATEPDEMAEGRKGGEQGQDCGNAPHEDKKLEQKQVKELQEE